MKKADKFSSFLLKLLLKEYLKIKEKSSRLCPAVIADGTLLKSLTPSSLFPVWFLDVCSVARQQYVFHL